jgi:DNA polymerase-3 subunit delta'
MNQIIGFDNEFKLIFDNLKNNTLNNSLLISGNKGIGKKSLILNIIKELIKIRINKHDINHQLTLIDSYSHPNIRILKKEMDEKTKKIKKFITIDQVRNLNVFSRETSIIDNLPKFIIIDSADDLNINSSNAILKILEEPKANTYFFLISHQPSSILSTIKSRCFKINLLGHNYSNFKAIISSQNFTHDDEVIKFFFDITNGSPGLSCKYDIEDILVIFDKLIDSIRDLDPFSEHNKFLVEKLSIFENDKLKIYLSLMKFILINLSKVKLNININDYYLSSNIKKIKNLSDNLSIDIINNKLHYLINNENDLFTFNLDKKIFMINFFAER